MSNFQLPQLIFDLVSRGIPVRIELDNGLIVYKLEGFYKSGGVTLCPYPENSDVSRYRLKDRYKEETVTSLSDVVYVHARWWESSKERFDGWNQPEEPWIPLLLEHGYIEEIPLDTRPRYRQKVCK